jgi:hypothetical protein
MEGFSLRWCDVDVTAPPDGPSMDLPPGCGAVWLYLSPETKSNCTRIADMLLAFETLSGYRYGLWFHRVRRACLRAGPWSANTDLIFQHDSGKPWTLYYFRHHFVYPALRAQVTEGDAYLTALTKGGGTLESKFWSMHFFRRGARSHATHGGRYGHRKQPRIKSMNMAVGGSAALLRLLMFLTVNGLIWNGSNSLFSLCELEPWKSLLCVSLRAVIPCFLSSLFFYFLLFVLFFGNV